MTNKSLGEFGKDGILPLAIVGLAFEFPRGATSEERFWQMLCNGECASAEFPSSRLNIDAFYHPDEDRPSSVRRLFMHIIEITYRLRNEEELTLGIDPSPRWPLS